MKRDREGTSAIEFALCLPFALLLVCGMVDGTRLMNAHHVIARATRDGARIGSITLEAPPSDGTEIVAAARDHIETALAAAGQDLDTISVDADWVERDNLMWIRVEISQTWSPMFPGLSPFHGPVTHDFWMITQEQ